MQAFVAPFVATGAPQPLDIPYAIERQPLFVCRGADGGGRTRTAVRPRDFKSLASTGSATSAPRRSMSHRRRRRKAGAADAKPMPSQEFFDFLCRTVSRVFQRPSPRRTGSLESFYEMAAALASAIRIGPRNGVFSTRSTGTTLPVCHFVDCDEARIIGGLFLSSFFSPNPDGGVLNCGDQRPDVRRAGTRGKFWRAARESAGEDAIRRKAHEPKRTAWRRSAPRPGGRPTLSGYDRLRFGSGRFDHGCRRGGGDHASCRDGRRRLDRLYRDRGPSGRGRPGQLEAGGQILLCRLHQGWRPRPTRAR